MWWTHAPIFNKWHMKKKKKKKTSQLLTHGAMWGCGLTSWVVSMNDKLHDKRERNVTIRSGIWTTNICSLGFWDIRECVTLWSLISQSLGCIRATSHTSSRACDHYTSSILVGRKGWSRSKFTSYYTWGGTNGVCECKMDVKSTWITPWHHMDHVAWSLGLFSKIITWR